MGVTAVDFDGDGILDLFATGFGGNAVYRGKGQCKFEDVTEKSGLKRKRLSDGPAGQITTATAIWMFLWPVM